MKKVTTLCLATVVFAIFSCGTATYIPGSWKKPGASASQFKSIFVSALTTDVWWPLYYQPGYYVTDKTYYLETNLYDASTEELIWSAQSATYNPASINDFLKSYQRALAKELKDDGLLAR